MHFRVSRPIPVTWFLQPVFSLLFSYLEGLYRTNCTSTWTSLFSVDFNSFSYARLYAPACLMCCGVYMWDWGSTVVQGGKNLHCCYLKCMLLCSAFYQHQYQHSSLRHLQRLWNPKATLWWYLHTCNPTCGAYESILLRTLEADRWVWGRWHLDDLARW